MLKLNHAVLKVKDLERSVAFYRDVFGFSEVARAGNQMAFMRAPGSDNHGATKSVYGVDPDGHEFEIMWMVPREQWGAYESQAPSQALDIERELERFGKYKV